MTQEVDHGANIVKMVSDRDDKIRELTTDLSVTAGRKDDLDAELRDLSLDHLALKIQIRSKDREHASEVELLNERIREVVGFCNEETRNKVALAAELESVKEQQQPISPVPFVLQLIMSVGINHYHAVIAQCAHAAVNRQTNKMSRTLYELNAHDNVVKTPSLYRVSTRYCTMLNAAVPASTELVKGLKDFIESNIDLFMKDAQYGRTRFALRQIYNARKNPAHLGFHAQDICKTFDWMEALSNTDGSRLTEDEDYADLVCKSVFDICRNLIIESFA